MGIQTTLLKLPLLYFDNKWKYNPESSEVKTLHDHLANKAILVHQVDFIYMIIQGCTVNKT